MLASKVEVSVNSNEPTLPQDQLVVDEFHRRMAFSLPASRNQGRYSDVSFHITNVEYKESVAMLRPMPVQTSKVSTNNSSPPQVTLADQSSIFCRNCGNKMPLDSKFCNKCGTSVN